MMTMMVNKLRLLLGENHDASLSPKGIVPKEYIRKFLPPNPVVVEAGASVGYDTIEMSRLWPRGMIYAFEPIPEIFRMLLEKTKSLNNVRCFPQALSDCCHNAAMFVSSDEFRESSSLMKPKIHLTEHPHISFPSLIEVESISLDAWAEENQVSKIDFLWLDLQGAERRVLSSSLNILKTVRAIYTEVNLKELYEGVVTYPEFRAWLEGHGFYAQREELPWEGSGNVLFVKRRKFW